MSAYIVNNKVVQIIATGFIQTNKEYMADDYKPKTQVIINYKQAIEEIAQSLINYNYKSVNYRYTEQNQPHKFKYTNDLPFDYELLYNAINEYDYQACEPSNYYTSPIKFSLERLKEGIIEHFLENGGARDDRYYEITAPDPIEEQPKEEKQEETKEETTTATAAQNEYFNNLMQLLN